MMRKIPSFPAYSACSNGFIWRYGRIVKPRLNRPDGYLSIKPSMNGLQRDAYVHRLVCEAWHGPCPSGKECRHKDGNRLNNAPSNLEWADHGDNLADRKVHGTMYQGEAHHLAVLNASLVREARSLARQGIPVPTIANLIGIKTSTVFNAVVGRTWAHVPGAVTNLRAVRAHRKSAAPAR